MQKVLVILGPTATGKSDLAVRLAKKFNGEIVSADSRQVYKGLDIGSGKITKEEMQGVLHHLLGVADPKERFSASMYKDLGSVALKQIIERNKLPIIAGGTGLYIDTLTCAVNFPNVPPNENLRKTLEDRSNEELLKMLKEKDPTRAGEVDPHNKMRLIRALEIVEVLGKVPKQKPSDSAYEFIYIGLKLDKEDLERRIEERLKKRLEGMIQEGENLHKDGLSYERMEELGLEYRYVAMHLQNKISKEEMFERLNTEIRQYSKRQMTWFKRNEKIKWFDPSQYQEIENYAKLAIL